MWRASGLGMTPFATQWELEIIMSYSCRSNISIARGYKGRKDRYFFLRNGNFWIKLVMIRLFSISSIWLPGK
jgi:hypothetical protein